MKTLLYPKSINESQIWNFDKLSNYTRKGVLALHLIVNSPRILFGILSARGLQKMASSSPVYVWSLIQSIHFTSL